MRTKPLSHQLKKKGKGKREKGIALIKSLAARFFYNTAKQQQKKGERAERTEKAEYKKKNIRGHFIRSLFVSLS